MSERFHLNEKVAIITGASSGIGAAIALEFSRLGAKLTLTGKNASRLKAVASKCQKVGVKNQNPLVVACDLTNKEVRHNIIRDTVNQFGKLDILVTNAGTYSAKNMEYTKEGLDLLDTMLDIHVRVSYHLTKLAIPEITKNKGVVINVSSIAGIKPFSFIGIEYSMAKSAMDQYSRWLSAELGPLGVRVNTISPGWIPSNILKKISLSDRNNKNNISKVIPLRRMGEVQEAAQVAAFLASEASSYVTGVILPVDGGLNNALLSVTNEKAK